MASDPEPVATLEVEGNSPRAAASLVTAISRELATDQLPSGVAVRLVGNYTPVVEERSGPGGMAYQVARVAAEYVMIRVAVHVRADAEDGVYRAVKRAVLGWRQKDPTTPIYGPDGRPVGEWLADQEERQGE